MTQSLVHVALLVNDYDEAIDFCTNKLDFELVEDTFIPEQDKRWVLVAPPGAIGCSILLAKADGSEQRAFIGNQSGRRIFLFLSTDDLWRDYRKYVERGILFVREPVEQAYGIVGDVVLIDKYISLCLITIALSLVGCKENISSVTGTLDFDGAVEISQVSRAELKLIDISIADASFILIAETIITEITQVPMQFEIEYVDSVIIERNSYSVSADIYMTDESGKERRSHLTTQTYPVLTRGFGSEANLLVQPIN